MLTDTLIALAGVTGLAVASELATADRELLLLEPHAQPGPILLGRLTPRPLPMFPTLLQRVGAMTVDAAGLSSIGVGAVPRRKDMPSVAHLSLREAP